MEFRDLQQGTILAGGKYTIEKGIGAGGFGITYKAVQHGLNRTVCIKEFFMYGKCVRHTQAKTVHLQNISKEGFEECRLKFVEEAKTLAKLKHTNIVEVLDVFDENNTSYMVMPFIEGQTLQSLVEKNGTLDYQLAVNYLGQIAEAVDYIHSKNILHRDIKPDNIITTPGYHAILIDFGSAREFVNDKTQAHTSILTKCYAPPEQYNTISRKGYYTDIYSLGAVYYFAMTGKAPLEAVTRHIETMSEPKSLNSAITEDANRTILKAMAMKPANRHQNIEEFLDDLYGRKPSEPIVDEVEKSRRKLWIALVVLAVVLIGVSVYFVLRPEKVVVVGDIRETIKTEDFTDMNLYPMVKVDGGTFQMGSDDESDDEDTRPVHSVSLDGYYIGQYEVSQKFWKEVMGSNPSEFQGDSLPVENVSIEMVQTFIQNLNNRTGKHFSLPTEAEWEYAARGGQKSKGYRYAGVQYPGNLCFNKDNPRKIASIQPNEIGLYHMSGNVAEWCLDYYDKNFYQNSTKTNPVNKMKCSLHVVRGGSFDDDNEKNVRVSCRQTDDNARDYIGFRLILK